MDPFQRPRTTEPIAAARAFGFGLHIRDDMDSQTCLRPSNSSSTSTSTPPTPSLHPQLLSRTGSVYRAPHLRNVSNGSHVASPSPLSLSRLGNLPPPPTPATRARPAALSLSRPLDTLLDARPASAPVSRLTGVAAARGLNIDAALTRGDQRRHTIRSPRRPASATHTPGTPGLSRKRGITMGVIVQDALVAESAPVTTFIPSAPRSAVPSLTNGEFPAPIGSGRPHTPSQGPPPPPAPTPALGPTAQSDSRTIILCRYYHTPGITCTSSPCRFVHNVGALNSPHGLPSPHSTSLALALHFDGDRASMTPASSSPGNGSDTAVGRPLVTGAEDPTRGTFAAAQAAAPVPALTFDEVDIARLMGGEIVTVRSGGEETVGHVFKLSGGGKGPGGRSRLKFKTVPCKDFPTGTCAYGQFCSFIHDPNNLYDEEIHGKGKPVPKEGEDGSKKDEDKTKPVPASDNSENENSIEPLSENKSEDQPSLKKAKSINSLPLSPTAQRRLVDDIVEPNSPPMKFLGTESSAGDSLSALFPPARPNSTVPIMNPHTPAVIAPLPLPALGISLLPDVSSCAPTISLPSPPSKAYPWAPLSSGVQSEWPDLSAPKTRPATTSASWSDMPVSPALPKEAVKAPKVKGKSRKAKLTKVKDVKQPAKAQPKEDDWPQLAVGKDLSTKIKTSAWAKPIFSSEGGSSNSTKEANPTEEGEEEEMTPTGLAPPTALPAGQIRESDLVYTPQGFIIRHHRDEYYQTKVCKFFANGVPCAHGQHCSFLHEKRPPLAPRQQSGRKHIICPAFNKPAGCRHSEEDCEFTHLTIIADPLKPAPVRRVNRACRHFLLGRCHMGNKCSFKHVVPMPSWASSSVSNPGQALGALPVPSATTATPATATQAGSTDNTGVTSETLAQSANKPNSGRGSDITLGGPLSLPLRLDTKLAFEDSDGLDFSSQSSLSTVSASIGSPASEVWSECPALPIPIPLPTPLSPSSFTPAMAGGTGYFSSSSTSYPYGSPLGSPLGGGDHCPAWAKDGTCPAGSWCPLSHVGEGEENAAQLTEEALAAACEVLRKVKPPHYYDDDSDDDDDDDLEIITAATNITTRTPSLQSCTSSPIGCTSSPVGETVSSLPSI